MLSAAAIGVACETTPPIPTVVPGPFVAGLATRIPGTWDSREELDGWVNNGASTPAATVDGIGDAAVIRVDAAAAPITLHGPDIAPPLNEVRSAQVRYRRIDAGSQGNARMVLYLRPQEFSPGVGLPMLTRTSLINHFEEQSGAWLVKRFAATSTTRGDCQTARSTRGGADAENHDPGRLKRCRCWSADASSSMLSSPCPRRHPDPEHQLGPVLRSERPYRKIVCMSRKSESTALADGGRPCGSWPAGA